MTVAIYSDGANIKDMQAAYDSGVVTGFTTNPSLMKRANVTDYQAFATEVTSTFPNLPISFEVFSDDFEGMEREAKELAAYGDNVFVKIPVMLTDGTLTLPVIERLSHAGVNLNITALMTVDQVDQVLAVLAEDTHNIISVFAGRLADIGVDPVAVMSEAVKSVAKYPQAELLWASTREVFNIYEADRLGVDIITVPPTIIAKYTDGQGKKAEDLSLSTVKGFAKDIAALAEIGR